MNFLHRASLLLILMITCAAPLPAQRPAHLDHMISYQESELLDQCIELQQDAFLYTVPGLTGWEIFSPQGGSTLPKSIELYEKYGDDWVNHEECCALFNYTNVARAKIHGILRKGTRVRVTRFEYNDDRYWGRLLMTWGKIEGGEFRGIEAHLQEVHQDSWEKTTRPMIDPLVLKVVPCPTE